MRKPGGRASGRTKIVQLHVGHHVHFYVGHHADHYVAHHVSHHVGHHNVISMVCEGSEALTEWKSQTNLLNTD